MIKNANKFISLVLVFVLVAALAGCGKNTAKSSPATGDKKETPEINFMLTWDPGVTINSDTLVFQEWAKRTGVKFNLNIPPRDSYKEKMNIVLASKELPDMMKFFQDDRTYNDYGPQLFVPLDDYLKNGKLPNLQKWLKKYPEIEKIMRNTEDGKLYGFPLIQDFDWVGNLWYVRNDMLKKEGMDASQIQTTDDLKKAMLALKKVNGKDYITSIRLGYGYYAFTSGAYFGVPAADGFMLDNNYQGSSGKYIFAPVDAGSRYKEWVEFEHWMFTEKLLHPSFLTMKDQELFAGYNDGSFPLMREQLTMPYSGNSSMNPKNDKAIDIQPIYPIKIDGKTITQAKSTHLNIGYRSPVVINKKAKNIDAMIKAMDYCYSDEGIELFMMGVEGQTFTKDSKTPSGYKLDKVKSVWTIGADGKYPEGMKSGADYGLSWWLTGVVPAYIRFGLTNYKEGEEKQAFVAKNEIDTMIKKGLVRDPDPVLLWNKDEVSKNTEISNAISTYLSENVSKFIMGSKPMSEWDSFIKGFDKLNYKELKDTYNAKLSKTK